MPVPERCRARGTVEFGEAAHRQDGQPQPQSQPKRLRTAARANPTDVSTRRSKQGDQHHVIASHPNGVKPAGNALLAEPSSRVANSLGLFTPLPHTLILSILGMLSPRDLARTEQVSHAFRAFALHEPLWRDAFLDLEGGRMRCWHGSWKATVAAHQLSRRRTDSSTRNGSQRDEAKPPGLSTPSVHPKVVFSDELFLPLQLASMPLDLYVPREAHQSLPYSRIKRLDPSTTSKADFLDRHAIPNEPCLFREDVTHTHELPRWSLDDLEELLGPRRIRAEALKMSMETYNAYARSCSSGEALRSRWIPDESPFYLFDPTLARSLQKQNRFVVPRLLRDDLAGNKGLLTREWDLFSLLEDQRPDNMWVIAGPARSGSGWHVDPNHTSAYNTVLSGAKLWLLLPPHITPPGVYISPDGASVTAPLSIAEWLRDFWRPCLRQHGRRGDDTLLVDVCGPGETIYVPAGWKHLVVNLDESVAFTQNFVSPAELPAVLDFLKNRPDQISGFRVKGRGASTKDKSQRSAEKGEDASSSASDSDGESEPELDELEDDGIVEKRKLFGLFAARLHDFDAGLYERGMEGLTRLEAEREDRKQSRKRAAAAASSTCQPVARTADGANGDSLSWWQSLKKGALDAAHTDDAVSNGATAVSGHNSSGTPANGLFAAQLGDADELLDEVPW